MNNKYSFECILKNGCKHFKYTETEIRQKMGKKPLMYAKKIVIYILYHYGKRNMKDVALFLGYPEHTTVMRALEIVREREQKDSHTVRNDINKIIKLCENEKEKQLRISKSASAQNGRSFGTQQSRRDTEWIPRNERTFEADLPFNTDFEEDSDWEG